MTAIDPSLLLSAEQAQHRAELDRAWKRPPGMYGWLTSTDHKEIGLRFVKTVFIFFCLAGVLALLMRIQLSAPKSRFLGPDLYNQIFTAHGTAMLFLFAVPVMEGMGLYLVPLVVGTRNVSFPGCYTFHTTSICSRASRGSAGCSATRDRTRGGSPTCRCRGRSIRRGIASICGRRW